MLRRALSHDALGQGPHIPVNRMTHTSEKITLPQPSDVGGKNEIIFHTKRIILNKNSENKFTRSTNLERFSRYKEVGIPAQTKKIHLRLPQCSSIVRDVDYCEKS